ncbi:MAG TPA: putative collagen-binding domain-containing protein, partial [Bacteroidales bacterium]|nr:putative collagen-binding domain-containing protein [Bacteroidales bacterium]
PLQEMHCMDDLTKTKDDYVFTKPGEIYLVYSKEGGRIILDLPDVGYSAMWYNPRTGDSSRISGLTESETVNLETPTNQDWLLYLHK